MWIDSNLYNVIKSVVPIFCVDCIIEYQNHILLIRRATGPAKDEWWFVGGRVYIGELLEDCAIRKCKEEVGLDCEAVEQIHIGETIFDSIHTINVVYHMRANSDNVVMDDTMSDYKWLNLHESVEILQNSYLQNCLHKFLINKRKIK